MNKFANNFSHVAKIAKLGKSAQQKRHRFRAFKIDLAK